MSWLGVFAGKEIFEHHYAQTENWLQVLHIGLSYCSVGGKPIQ